MTNHITPSTVLYATRSDEEGAELARQFCRDHELTPDDARIVRRPYDDIGAMVCVVAKRECKVKLLSKSSAV